MQENEIGRIVVDQAVTIHRKLGPGLLESVYEAVLAHYLRAKGLSVQRQGTMPIVIDGVTFNEGFRADIVVDNKVILELKSIERLNNSHRKQLLTYLKLSGMKLGFLLNFGAPMMKDGIVRTVNKL